MDPSAGRFLSVDPFGWLVEEPDSLHRYLYAVLDPTGNVDPTGRYSFSLSQTRTVLGVAPNLFLSLYGIYSGIEAFSEGKFVRGLVEVGFGFLGLGVFSASIRVLRFLYSATNIAIRACYFKLVSDIGTVVESGRRLGWASRKIAETVIDMRNMLKLQNRAAIITADPIAGRILVKYLELRNWIAYTNKIGPTLEYYTVKLGRSYDDILESALRTSEKINQRLGVV